jgi:hypothetical protein
MATLPDLDTSSIGLMAFWNAIDQGGVDSIDPMEATGVFNEYTVYDNGIEGPFSGLRGNRTLKARIKTDGWIIIWMDNQNDFGTQSSSDGPGYGLWEVITNPLDATSGSDLGKIPNDLDKVRESLSNAGNMTWNAADVGFYSPPHPDATNVTCLSVSSDGSGAANKVGSVDFTTSTPYYFAATGAGKNDDERCEISVVGNSKNITVSQAYSGTLNVLNEGYDLTNPISMDLLSDHRAVAGAFFIIWS